MQVLGELVRRWKAEGLSLLPPHSPEVVHDTFARTGWAASNDVVTLYAAIGGMTEMDREYWRLWSLAEVMAENPQPEPLGLMFSDYMVGCWCYRLKPNSPHTSSVFVDYFDGRTPTLVANTLADFFEAYARSATLLLDAQALLPAGK